MRFKKGTIAVHEGRPDRVTGSPLNVAPDATSTYVAGSSAIYARETQYAVIALEDTVGALEEGYGVAFASGMATVTAVLDYLASKFDRPPRILAPRASYLGTISQLNDRALHLGWKVSFSSAITTEALLEQMSDIDIIWIETPTNPQMIVFDIRALAKRAGEIGAVLCVDNTAATPILQNPICLGADIVIHSATKFLSGHSDVIGGIAVVRERALALDLKHQRTLYGSILGPFEAYLILRGIRTLHLRVERATSNATELAMILERHPKVTEVHYPFLDSSPYYEVAKSQMTHGGALFGLELGISPYRAERFCDLLRLGINSTSFGGVETQIERRARHGDKSVGQGFVRVCVGVEDIEDLVEDFEAALEKL